MSISSRYHSAVHAKSLRPDSHKGDIGTQYTDTDVLAAYGRAAAHLERGRDAKGDRIRPAPLAVPLERLLAGGSSNSTVHEIVAIMSDMVISQSWKMKIKISRPAAHDMACMCLAWYRHGACRQCGGHGFDLQPGTPSLSSHQCKHCKGTGKVLIDLQFKPEIVPLSRWLLTEMERETGRAGEAAMKALASRMDI